MIHKFSEIGCKGFMPVTIDCTVKHKHECRENNYNRKHADYNALCHNYTDIESERKLHKAKCKETEKRCQGAAGK